MDRFDRCWDIQECAHKEQCSVYPHYGRSCWLIKGKLHSLFVKDDEFICDKSCESCEVYHWNMAFLGRRLNEPAVKPFHGIASVSKT